MLKFVIGFVLGLVAAYVLMQFLTPQPSEDLPEAPSPG